MGQVKEQGAKAPIEFITTPRECQICGGTMDNRMFYAQERMLGMGDRFKYMECGTCKAIALMEPPDDIAKYYPKDYYSFSTTSHNERAFSTKVKDVLVRSLVAYRSGQGSVLGALVSLVHNKFRWIRPGMFKWSTPVLDVGCGGGGLLRMLSRAGFTDLTGIDPFIQQRIDLPEGIAIHKKEIHQLDRQFGFIMLNHVFEHLQDPRSSLQAIKDSLLPGGNVMLRIPIADNFAWKHYGEHWVQLDAPRHFFLHTKASIGLLAQQAGLSLDHVQYDSTEFQFVGSEKYLRGLRLDAPSDFLTREKLSMYRRKAKELNRKWQGDTASFYLSKA